METRPRIRPAGFTMIELLMTIAIAAIVAMIGIPSFQYVTNSNRVASELNGLLGDLQFARGEALKEGQNIIVCVSQTGAGCYASTGWQKGWMVFSDPTNAGTYIAGDTILRVQAPFTGTDTFTASNNVEAITFNREGYATTVANGTLISLHTSTPNNNWTRCLSINLSGMMSSLKYNQVASGFTCN